MRLILLMFGLLALVTATRSDADVVFFDGFENRTAFTVGGTVTGLSGTVTLQINSANDLSLSSNGPFTFGSMLADGTDFAVTVSGNPAGQTCMVSNGTGTISGADVRNVTIDCQSNVVGFHTGGLAVWNDYVLNDGTGPYGSATPCVGAEPGPYRACWHSGELLAFLVPGRSACSGLTAVDALGTFSWTCLPTVPDVTIVSTGLRPDRGLADLVEFASIAWRDNAVTVSDGDGPFLTSAPAKWFSNPLLIPDLGPETFDLDQAGAIYVLAGGATGTLNFTASNVGLVIEPGATLNGSGGSVPGALSTHPGTRFLWMEGDIVAAAAASAIHLNGAARSVLRHIVAQDGDIDFVDSSSNDVFGVFLTRAADGLMLDSTSDFNSLARVSGFGQSITSIRISGSNNVLMDIVAASSRVGVYISGTPAPASSNVLLGATAATTESYAFWFHNAPNSTAMNLATVSANIGINFSDATTAQLHNIAATDTWSSESTSGTGVRVMGAALATFSGEFKVGNNTRDCQEGVTEVVCTTLAAGANITSGVSLASSFIGQAGGDGVNSSGGANGTAAYTPGLDFLRFENRYRGWGIEADYPSVVVQGECVSGTCRIYDFSAAEGDSVARAALTQPGATAAVLTHTWTVTGATECSAVPGATWDGNSCTSSFVENSTELAADGIGNDNGLCEDGEACLYTANIGAYAGHDALVFLGWGGPAGDIALFGHTSNGR